jgi:hypothetical protein
VHIREADDSWRIFVPENEQQLEICYARQLPDAIAKLFQIRSSAREDLGNVLRSSIANINALLDDAGVADVPGVEAQPTRGPQGSSQTSPDISNQPPTPSSSGFGEPRLPRSVPPGIFPHRSPSPVHEFDANAVYRDLLDNVIRIASRISIPRRDAEIVLGDGQFHEGHDHEAAFGVRSQAQMAHDTRIGAAGELFVSSKYSF